MATTNGSTAIRDKILASLARYRALRIGKFPCAFWRLSSRPGLTAYEEMLKFPIDQTLYQDKEKIKTIDAFIFRFIKLQDFMGERLFKEVLKSVGEYKDSMALIDCLDKLEKLEIITQADQWMNYRTIRNKLTHEYSTNQEEMIAGIQLAMVYFKEINEVLNSINHYLQKKQLC